ncbi:hypothetical protein [uncultured Deefgea sp.]|uniref:hypothetical protein n=1 Tax=uncultured Deefgea sp. TaxID=1304914 RepID=UPI00262F2B47|nr:hypothetical protein [uncultured Deefgea sp.]
MILITLQYTRQNKGSTLHQAQQYAYLRLQPMAPISDKIQLKTKDLTLIAPYRRPAKAHPSSTPIYSANTG